MADVLTANSRYPKPLKQYNSPLALDVASDLSFTTRTYISSEHRLYTKHVSALLSPTTLNENATSNSKHLPPPTCLPLLEPDVPLLVNSNSVILSAFTKLLY